MPPTGGCLKGSASARLQTRTALRARCKAGADHPSMVDHTTNAQPEVRIRGTRCTSLPQGGESEDPRSDFKCTALVLWWTWPSTSRLALKAAARRNTAKTVKVLKTYVKDSRGPRFFGNCQIIEGVLGGQPAQGPRVRPETVEST